MPAALVPSIAAPVPNVAALAITAALAPITLVAIAFEAVCRLERARPRGACWFPTSASAGTCLISSPRDEILPCHTAG
jgi:hypothetical protein